MGVGHGGVLEGVVVWGWRWFGEELLVVVWMGGLGDGDAG